MAIASSKDGYTKTTAVKNSDTLYIFEDNLQAKMQYQNLQQEKLLLFLMAQS